MKLLLFLTVLTLVSFPVSAQNANQGEDKGPDLTDPVEQIVDSTEEEDADTDESEEQAPPKIQNENQVNQNTQNMSEQQKIQVTQQEQEILNEDRPEKPENPGQNNKPQNAQENMSAVAKKVQELLADRDSFEGIGEEISQFAQEQNEAQERIQNNFRRLEERKEWMKKLFGADNKAIEELKRVKEENLNRIRQIHEWVEESDPENQQELTDMLDLLQTQNEYINEKIEQEETVKGIFSFITNLFK
jgi:hypothetical protein